MNLDQLIVLEEQIEPFMESGYFTVIAPSNPATFDWFVEMVYKTTTANSMVSLLSNRSEVRNVLRTLNPEIDLKIYVIPKAKSDILIRQSLSEFIEEHQLQLPI